MVKKSKPNGYTISNDIYFEGDLIEKRLLIYV